MEGDRQRDKEIAIEFEVVEIKDESIWNFKPKSWDGNWEYSKYG